MDSVLRRQRLAAVLLTAFAPLASCYTSVGKWTYPSGRYATTAGAAPAPAVVAVEPLLDLRSATNRSWMIWSYIPLMPLGWTHFDRPEATVQNEDTTEYDADPTEDIARSIAIELRRSGVVAQAEYSPNAQREARHTHVVRGILRAFYVYEQRWTYGLSIYAPVFWALGLPMGTSDNGFCVDLELLDAKNGRVLWQGRIFDTDSHVEGYYYGPDWYRFSWMWERRLRERLGEIAAALGTAAPPLPDNLSEELRLLPPPVLPTCLGPDSDTPCVHAPTTATARAGPR